MKELSLSPPKVEFLGVTTEQVYTVAVRIINVSKRSVKVRMNGPTTESFCLQADVEANLPPGLSQTIHISFYTEDMAMREFHDSIVLYTINEQLELPLFAEKCRPHLSVHTPRVDFGNVIPGYAISRDIEVENRGTENATFTISVDEVEDELERGSKSSVPPLSKILSFSTMSGSIPCNKVVMLRATINCDKTGAYRGIVRVSDQYKHEELIDVSFNVIEPGLIYYHYLSDAVKADTLTSNLSNIKYSTFEGSDMASDNPHAQARKLIPLDMWRCQAIFQESVTKKIVAQNVSPYVMNFEFQVEVRDKRPLCNVGKRKLRTGETEESAAAAQLLEDISFITIEPSSGILQPGEKVEVQLTFAPKLDLTRIERVCRFMSNTTLSEWRRIFEFVSKNGAANNAIGGEDNISADSFDTTLIEKLSDAELKRFGAEFQFFKTNLDNIAYVYEVRTKCSASSLHKTFTDATFFSVSAMATRPLVSISDNIMHFSAAHPQQNFSVKNMSMDKVKVRIRAPSSYHIDDPLNHNEITTYLKPKEQRIFYLCYIPKSMTAFNDYMYVFLGDTDYYQVTVSLNTNKDKEMVTRLQTTKAVLDTGNKRVVEGMTLGDRKLLNATELKRYKEEQRLARDKTYDANKMRIAEKQQKESKKALTQRGTTVESGGLYNYAAMYMNDGSDSSEEDDAKYEVCYDKTRMGQSELDGGQFRSAQAKSKSLPGVSGRKDQVVREPTKLSAYNDALDLGMPSGYAINDYDTARSLRKQSRATRELDQLDKDNGTMVVLQPKKRATLANDTTAPVKLFAPSSYDSLELLRISQDIKELSTRELALISTGPMSFDFGTVTVGTKVTRYFKMANDLKSYIKIELKSTERSMQEEKQKKRSMELVEDSQSEEFVPGETLPNDIGTQPAPQEVQKAQKRHSVPLVSQSTKVPPLIAASERSADENHPHDAHPSKQQISPLKAAKIDVQPCIQYLPPGSMAGFPITTRFVNVTPNYADSITVYLNDKEYGTISLAASIKKPTIRFNVRTYAHLREARDLIEKYGNLLMKSVSESNILDRGDRERVVSTPIGGSTNLMSQLMSEVVYFELTPANIYERSIQRNISITNTGTAPTALSLTVDADCVFVRSNTSGGDYVSQPLSGSNSCNISTMADSLKKSGSSTQLPKNSGVSVASSDIFTLTDTTIRNLQSESSKTIQLTWTPSNAEVTAGVMTMQATKGDMLYVPVIARLLPGKAFFAEKFIDYQIVNIGKVARASCTIVNKSVDTECYFELLERDIVGVTFTERGRNYLTVDVTRGRLGPGERLQLQVSFTAMVLGPVSTKLCFRIIGGEQIELPVRAIIESPQIIVSELIEGQPTLSLAPSPSMTSVVTTACSSPAKPRSRRAGSQQSKLTKENRGASPAGSVTGTGKPKVRYQNIIQTPDSDIEEAPPAKPLVISPPCISLEDGVTQSIPTLRKFRVSNVSRVPADLFVDCTLSQYVSLVSDIGTQDDSEDAASKGVISTLITKSDLLERFRMLSASHMSQSAHTVSKPHDSEYSLSTYVHDDSSLGVTESLLRAQKRLVDDLAKKHNLPIFPNSSDQDYQAFTISLLNSNEIPSVDDNGKLKQLKQLDSALSASSECNRVLHIYIPAGAATTLILSVFAADQKPQVNDCVFFYILGQTDFNDIHTSPSAISVQKATPSVSATPRKHSRKSSEVEVDALRESSLISPSAHSKRESRGSTERTEPTLKVVAGGKTLTNALILSYNIMPAAIITNTSIINFGIKVADASYKQTTAMYPAMFREMFQAILTHLGLDTPHGDVNSTTISTDTAVNDSNRPVDRARKIAQELPFISQMAPSGLYYQDVNLINQTNKVVLFVAIVVDYNDQLPPSKLYAINQPLGKIQPYDHIGIRVFFSPSKVGVHNAKLKFYYMEVPVADQPTEAAISCTADTNKNTLSFAGDGNDIRNSMVSELEFFCNKGFVAYPYLTIHLQSVAVFRTIAFSSNPVIFPNTAVGVPSRCLFYIRNLGYKHNVKLSIAFPPELSKIAFCVMWPIGNTINHMIRTLPVIITFISSSVMSFSSRCVISDDEGTPYNLVIGGNCANDPYLLREYLRINSKRIQQGPQAQTLASTAANLAISAVEQSADELQKEIYDLVPRGPDPQSLSTPEFGVYHTYAQLAELCKADETDPLLRKYGLNKNILLTLESNNCTSLIEFSEYSKALGLEETFYSIKNKKDAFSAIGLPEWNEDLLAHLQSVTLINYTAGKGNGQGEQVQEEKRGTHGGSSKEKKKQLFTMVQRLLFGPYATAEYPRYSSVNNRLAFYWHFVFRKVGSNSESCLTPYISFIPDVVGLSVENNITIDFMVQTLTLLLNLRLNTNLQFPNQFTQQTSKTSPFLQWVCGLLKKGININLKTLQNLPSILKHRVDFIYSCYDEMLTALKINGGMLNNVPCELLMSRDDFLNWCKWSLAKVARNCYTSALATGSAFVSSTNQTGANKKGSDRASHRADRTGVKGAYEQSKVSVVSSTATILPPDEFEPQLVSPMINQTNALILLDILRAVHEFSHRSAWYYVLSELVRLFVLSTTTSPKVLEANIQKHKLWVSNEASEFGLDRGICDLKHQKESTADFSTKFDSFVRTTRLSEYGCLLYFFTYHASFMLHGTEFQEIVINKKYTAPKPAETKDKKNVVTRSQVLQRSAKKTQQGSALNSINATLHAEDLQTMPSPRRSTRSIPNFYFLRSSRALFSGFEVGLTILSHYPYCEGIRKRVEDIMAASIVIAKSMIELSVTNFTPDYILNLKTRIPEVTDRMFANLEAARAALWLEIEQFLRIEFNIILMSSSLYMTHQSSTFDYSHNVAYTNALATNHQILATLLYQVLPSYLPYKTLRILANLGDTVTQPLEVANVNKASTIKYKTSILYPRSDDVSVSGPSCEIKLSTTTLSIEPRMTSTLHIKMTPRFAKPCVALIGLRPSYDSSDQTFSGSFPAQSFVAVIIETNDTIPVKVYEVESKCQQQAKISIDVENKNGMEANFKIRINEKFVALDANSLLMTAKPKKVFGFMEPLQTQTAKTVNPTEKKDPEIVTEPLCGVTTSPIAFKTNERSLTIKPRGRQSLNLYYIPTHPGAYIASVIFEDNNLGSFMYELRGYSILPDTSCTYNISSLATESKSFIIDISDLFDPDTVYKYVNCDLRQVFDPKPSEEEKTPQTIQLASTINQLDKTFAIKYTARPNIEPNVHAFRFLIVTDRFTKQGLIYLNLLKRQEEIQMEMIVPAREIVSQKLPVRNTADNECTMSITITSQNGGQRTGRGANQKAQGFSLINYLHINGQTMYDGVPYTMVVRPHDSPFILLEFKPKWMTLFNAKLVIRNTTKDLLGDEYLLKCQATEPLASGIINMETIAMEPIVYKLTVSNLTTSPDQAAQNPQPVRYSVYLQDRKAVFELSHSTFDLLPGASQVVELRGFSPCSGQSKNVLMVQNATSNTYEWYDVSLHVKPRECSGVIELQAATNTSVRYELPITNTRTDIYATLNVEVLSIPYYLLSFNASMYIEPGDTQSFVLTARPTCRGTLKGVIIFNSMELGETWYELVINCTELAVKEETIYSLLSSQVSSKIMIENPNPGAALTYTIENSNHNAFTSQPKTSFVVQHSSQDVVKINYRPTKVNQPEIAEFYICGVDGKGVIQSEYRYVFRGIGQMPKEQAITRIYANVGSSNAGVVTFKNPFLTSSLLRFDYESSPDLQFNIRPEMIIQPFCDVQLPLTFTPKSLKVVKTKFLVHVQQLADTEAGIDTAEILRMGEESFTTLLNKSEVYTFTYPIEAIAEIVLNETFAFMACSARNSISVNKPIPFDSIARYSAGDLSFFIEPIDTRTLKPDSAFHIAQKSIQFVYKPSSMLNSNSTPNSRLPQVLGNIREMPQIAITFNPMKPFACDVNMIIAVRNSGRYKLPLQLVANTPKPEGTITVELANSNTEGEYILKICNIYNVYTEYKASFSPTSSERFSVSPTSGILEPAVGANTSNQKMTHIKILCSPGNSQARGQLFIETKDVLFIWDVISGYKRYVPPTGVSKVVCHE